jgi:hypothetical protein
LSSASQSVAVRGEPRIVAQLHGAERLAQARPLPLAPCGHGDLAVGGGERLVRHDVGMGVPAPDGSAAADERVVRLVDEDGERRFED